MRIWRLGEVRNALGLPEEISTKTYTGVEIDSRKVNPGGIFIGIRGEKFDGSDFAVQAIANGTDLAIVSKYIAEIPQDKQIVVADGLEALTAMARFARAEFTGKVAGITGSVGKTSVKELCALAFSAFGATFASRGNYNNHIGLPLNLVNLSQDAEFAILEMGMNHAGEITALTQIAKPNVAVITGVEAVHLEFFQSLTQIADAKAEIFLPRIAAVLNTDNAYYSYLKQKAESVGVSRIISFGADAGSSIRLLSFNDNIVQAAVYGKETTFALNSRYIHQALNALAALAAVSAFNLNPLAAAEKLAEFKDGSGRGVEITCELPDGTGFTVIDDSYNASPASMKAALLAMKDRKGRKVAVLGDMLELGVDAPAFHKELAVYVDKAGINLVITCGELMKNLFSYLPEHVDKCHTEDWQKAYNVLILKANSDDNILIKGSHGSQVHRIASKLLSAKELQVDPFT